MARAVELLAEGKVDPTPLIVAQYPLREAAEALQHGMRPGVLKVLVEGE